MTPHGDPRKTDPRNSDPPKEPPAPEPEESEESERKWGKADTWLAVLFLLTTLGIGATGLMTLLRAAGRLH